MSLKYIAIYKHTYMWYVHVYAIRKSVKEKLLEVCFAVCLKNPQNKFSGIKMKNVHGGRCCHLPCCWDWQISAEATSEQGGISFSNGELSRGKIALSQWWAPACYKSKIVLSCHWDEQLFLLSRMKCRMRQGTDENKKVGESFISST